VIVREDLGSVGYQTAQATHAAIDYCMMEQPTEWWKLSNRLVVLTVADEAKLFALYDQCMKLGRKAILFCEPDTGYQATSLAIEPSDVPGPDLGRLPLVGKRVAPEARQEVREALCKKMETARQNDKQTIMAHGVSVKDRAFSIVSALSTGEHGIWSEVLPESMLTGKFGQYLLDHRHPAQTIWNYTLFHDCGKPDCMVLDDDGRRHFPEHEKVSSQVWQDLGSGDEVRLMSLDMTLHRMKADEFDSFIKSANKQDICTLLLVSYAEIVANALDNDPLGLESVSFKIKKKHLDRLTKKIERCYM
jgi:hypothetical protein